MTNNTKPTPPQLPPPWIIAALAALLAPIWYAWLTDRGPLDTIIAAALGAATGFAIIAIGVATKANR